MKKTIVMLAAAVCIAGAATAQKKEKEVKYDKLYYKTFNKETDDVTISVDNAVSTDGETKFKLKITNKTNDFLIYKPEESKFIVNGKEMKAKEKILIIKPNASDFRVINLKGDKFNSVKSYTFVADGMYLASPGQLKVAAPDFKLPASNNDFTAGDFKCSMTKLYKESDQTDVKFKVVYSGQKIGFIDPSKVAVKMPDGNEYAAVKQGGGLLGGPAVPIMLVKGEDDSFSLKWDRMEGGKKMDMQKVEMNILWRDAFSECVPKKLKAEELAFEFDEQMSNEKGK
ncbi:MAG: hypothetical protein ACXVPQ_13775 [Bacteroidia bacterium]